ncbi:MAG: hypothetical protein ACAI35_23990 [Candidatus Methylacidiphilales bacterium]|nr:hypothetical protein [Candidatus Methylacidiphilales bacterium]
MVTTPLPSLIVMLELLNQTLSALPPLSESTLWILRIIAAGGLASAANFIILYAS